MIMIGLNINIIRIHFHVVNSADTKKIPENFCLGT